MYRDEIHVLHEMEEQPCLSMIVPTSRYPDRASENRIHLKHALEDAKRCLGDANQLAPEERRQILENTEETIAALDRHHFLDGLAIYATSASARAVKLPIAVSERVLVRDRFAVRDLIHAESRMTRYYLLLVSERGASLYAGSNECLEEIHEGFPLEHVVYESAIERMESSAPVGGWLGGGGKRNVRGDASFTPGTYVSDMQGYESDALRRHMIDVDERLAKIQLSDRRPVVLMTTGRNASEFKKISRQAELIAAEISGAFDGMSVAQLTELLAAPLEKMRADKVSDSLVRLADAAGNNSFASGLSECWKMAREGRCETLMVEKGYFARGYEVNGQLVLAAGEDAPEEFDRAHPEAVDDVIELAYEKGADIVFMDEGVLAEHDRIAMILRY